MKKSNYSKIFSKSKDRGKIIKQEQQLNSNAFEPIVQLNVYPSLAYAMVSNG